MKKLLVVLSLAMAALSFQAGAATFSLINLTSGDVDIAPNLVVDSEQISGNFTTAWEFGSDTDGNAVVAITGNPTFTFDTLVKVNGVDVLSLAASALDKVFNISFLAGDIVEFLVSGSANRGNIDISVSGVPVPAAVWLFGSALMGMMGVSRRKKA